MGTTLIPPTKDELAQPEEAIATQREGALRVANRARAAKRILVDRIGGLPLLASVQMVCDILDDPPEALDGMRVHQLLMAVRGLGEAKAAMICRAAHVSELIRLRDLRPGERESLIRVFRTRAGLS